ncbi:hypothetical protein SAMN05216178_3994 [Pseudomonas saponiphila]|uniref:Phage-like protein n=1 Tax=Pseudomonas saponiphila TaxID=556534 RepID=A0A1H4R0Q3_9PSED|nr:hypothetical protein [Pseudomonas saponiphila]SEC25509.1 hypothetical protein SAMN05216178_3994 [Pseudomonas saponiphila]
MIYRNVISAVVRALAAETINSAGGCDFEPKVQASKLKGEITGKDAALLIDCMVHKVLHAQLSPRHWNALTAKFSTHNGRKIEATGRLVAIVTSPAPALFTRKAVTAWAIPQIKGVRKEPVKARTPEFDEGVPSWRVEAAKAAIRRANAKEEQKAGSRSSDMIVLADSNYDMNTWDNQGMSERTYQLWNKAIKKALESLVDDALVEAQLLLEAAGVLGEQAA